MPNSNDSIALFLLSGLLPADVVPTAKAMKRLNNVMDVLNSSSKYDSCVNKRAITPATEGSHIAVLEDAYSWIGRWRIGDDVRVHFVKGLRQTIVGIILIWRSLRASGQTSLCTRRLNQDGLENLFGVIRMCNGGNDVPDASQFRMAYRKAVLTRVLAPPASANCEADGDRFMEVLSSVASRVSRPVPAARVTYTSAPAVIDEVVVDEVVENCIAYVGGYLVRKSQDDHCCNECLSVLTLPSSVVGSRRAVLSGLNSFTGRCVSDVGSLLQPTDLFFLFLVHTYVIAQSQAPTILQECGIARRIVECALDTREAEHLSGLLCTRKVLRDMTARFVRLQLHRMCRMLGGGGRGKSLCNRKMMKVCARL